MTAKPGVLQSMGSQRVRYDLVTEQQQQSRDKKLVLPLTAVSSSFLPLVPSWLFATQKIPRTSFSCMCISSIFSKAFAVLALSSNR